MTNWILVDYENVQPTNFDPDKQQDAGIFVFLGPSQNKIPADLVAALQPFGPAVRYIQMPSKGKNALDFHIAFYLGELVTKHPGDVFRVVSRDTGFDPLVKHLADREVDVKRVAGAPTFKSPAPNPSPKVKGGQSARVESVRKKLVTAGHARPRKTGTLKNWIRSTLAEELSDAELSAIFSAMRSRKLIAVTGDKVSYTL